MTGARRGSSPPSSSDGSRLTVSPSRRARIKVASGLASGSSADGVKITRVTGRAALRQIVDDVIEHLEIAAHRNAADALPAIGRRRRQNADRPDIGDGAAFDAAQQHLGVGGAAEDQRRIGFRRARMMPRARIAEIAIRHARAAQQHDLQDPVERDRDLAEEVLAEHIRRDQKIVDDQQRHREHRRGAHDVHQVRQRGEPPLRFVEVEQEIDDAGINHESRQERKQRIQPFLDADRLEADVAARDHGHRGHEKIMRDDQRPARTAKQ